MISFLELSTRKNATLRSTTMSMPGTLESVQGQLKWFAPNLVTLRDVIVGAGTAPSSNITVELKKNGIVFETITLASGLTETVRIELNESMVLNDKLTADVTATSGEDLSVSIRYY